MKKKRVAILGSTGSIGINTLDIIQRNPDRFEVVLLTAFNNIDLLAEQVKKFRPARVALAKEHIPAMAGKFRNVKFFDVLVDTADLVAEKDVDAVVLAMSGSVALDPFLSAVKAGKTVAPANKEALVIAGEMIMRAARVSRARVIPVDSEQSAIFQSLEGHRRSDVRCVHLTASGGPLLNVPASRHKSITVDDVLRHPRWKMGAKITVDSATLMNKGFEVIEAQRLFSLDTEQVKVVIHPEALLHSLVEYVDGSMIGQFSETDMRIPIQYALTYPERLNSGFRGVDFARIKALTFAEPDLKRFPSLALAFEVSRLGGTYPAVLNAADEVAVQAFLTGRLSFTGIYKVVERVVRSHKGGGDLSLKNIKNADAWSREQAEGYLRKVK